MVVASSHLLPVNMSTNSKKTELELVLLVALGMVAYTVVKQLGCRKKRKARKKIINKARPNFLKGTRAIYPHQRALDAIYTNFLG